MADQPIQHADAVLDDVEEKLASIRGNRDYDKGWRDALQWVLETATTHSDGSTAHDGDRQEWLQHAYNALCGAIGSLKMIREAFDDDLSNIAMDIESARSRLSPIAHPEERHNDGIRLREVWRMPDTPQHAESAAVELLREIRDLAYMQDFHPDICARIDALTDGLATGGVISKEVAQEIGRSIGQHSCVVEQWGAECEEFGCHDDGADT